MEPEGSLPYSQVSATGPYPKPTLSSPNTPIQPPEDSRYLIESPFSFYCVIPPLETLPPPLPGEPNGGVVYLRIVLSSEEASRLMSITKQ
jgi:hypothetical protein